GEGARALDFAGRAAGIAAAAGNPGQLWKARILAGHAYLTLKQPEPARRSFDQAIAIGETMRGGVAGGDQEQRRFLATRVGPYDEMVELLAGENHPAEAFAYAERSKARVLLEILRGGRVNVVNAMTPQEK